MFLFLGIKDDDITYIVSPDQPHGLPMESKSLRTFWERLWIYWSICEFQGASGSQSGSLQFWRSVWDLWERLWNVLYQKNHSMKKLFLQSARTGSGWQLESLALWICQAGLERYSMLTNDFKIVTCYCKSEFKEIYVCQWWNNRGRHSSNAGHHDDMIRFS